MIWDWGQRMRPSPSAWRSCSASWPICSGSRIGGLMADLVYNVVKAAAWLGRVP
jgi:hypothetical protein